ncbi:hypothetical protein D9615_009037 [Tricholomella constricta]|uniref:CCHC-type domain-containing protein n=1 Tax=Tricholomella constricta TaxID=117010 RepID=A0A8H5H0T8_9AGAR|nr:hypothetical protein D9615_009037 [Tricholomella constricta]
MSSYPTRGRGSAQQGHPTILGPRSLIPRRVLSNPTRPSTTQRGPPPGATLLDPPLPQSFAVSSAPASPFFATQNIPLSSSQHCNVHPPDSWSQTPFLPPTASQQDLTQVPSYSSPRPTFPSPSLVPLPQVMHAPLLPPPPPPPASSAGLSYVSSAHLPIVQHPFPTPVRSPSIHSLHSTHHILSPPVSHASLHRPIDPVAPVPLRPILFDNINRIVSPSHHSSIAPAPPYFQHQFNPVPHFSPQPNRPPVHSGSSFRSLSASSLHLPFRPASAPRLSPLSPSLRLQQLPRSLPASPAIPAFASPVPLTAAISPTRSLSTYTKPDFPNLSSIPLLTSANDWTKWHSAVLQVIEATGLYDHIVDVLPAEFILDPTAYPSLPPQIDRAHYTSEELDLYKAWWTQDDVVSFVLLGKLGPIPLSLIPPKRDAWGNPQRTARDILRLLRTKYGVYDAVSAAAVRESVLSKKVVGNDVTSYVDAWRKAVLQVEGSHWDFSSFDKVQRFADGLPRTFEYEPLRVMIREGFNSNPPHGVISFHDASQAALNIELASRRLSSVHPSAPRRSQASSSSGPASSSANASTPSSTDPPAVPPQATRPRCSNCGAIGHVAGNCWEPGGGDVGGRDRYLAANPPRPRAHVAIAPDTPLDPIVESTEPEIEPATEPISAYAPPDASLPAVPDTALYLDFANVTSPVVLASLADRFNAILDSGCTVHIIRDRKYFWTYDTTLAVPVGTANCGTLTTLAKGEVRFRITIDGIEQIVSLQDCLHAPDVPINLLSVGSMTEKNVRLVFEKNITSIHFPDNVNRVPTHSINATVVRRLSFLHLDFVLPPDSSTPNDPEFLIALPAVDRLDTDLFYHRVDPTPNLWHRRFGHLV